VTKYELLKDYIKYAITDLMRTVEASKI